MNYLKNQRQRFNLTQLEVSRFTGIERTRITRLEQLTQNQFEAKCYLCEFKEMRKLFDSCANGTIETYNYKEPFKHLEVLQSNKNYSHLNKFEL